MPLARSASQEYRLPFARMCTSLLSPYPCMASLGMTRSPSSTRTQVISLTSFPANTLSSWVRSFSGDCGETKLICRDLDNVASYNVQLSWSSVLELSSRPPPSLHRLSLEVSSVPLPRLIEERSGFVLYGLGTLLRKSWSHALNSEYVLTIMAQVDL